MSFFSRLLNLFGLSPQDAPREEPPADRGVTPEANEAFVAQLRHQARTGNPTIGRHHKGSF